VIQATLMLNTTTRIKNLNFLIVYK